MGGACGTYGGEEECLQNFERKNYRSVFVVMLNLAMVHPVVHECMYHKVFISADDTTRAICLSFCAADFHLHEATIRIATCIKQTSAKHTVSLMSKTHTRGPEFCD